MVAWVDQQVAKATALIPATTRGAGDSESRGGPSNGNPGQPRGPAPAELPPLIDQVYREAIAAGKPAGAKTLGEAEALVIASQGQSLEPRNIAAFNRVTGSALPVTRAGVFMEAQGPALQALSQSRFGSSPVADSYSYQSAPVPGSMQFGNDGGGGGASSSEGAAIPWGWILILGVVVFLVRK